MVDDNLNGNYVAVKFKKLFTAAKDTRIDHLLSHLAVIFVELASIVVLASTMTDGVSSLRGRDVRSATTRRDANNIVAFYLTCD